MKTLTRADYMKAEETGVCPQCEQSAMVSPKNDASYCGACGYPDKELDEKKSFKEKK